MLHIVCICFSLKTHSTFITPGIQHDSITCTTIHLLLLFQRRQLLIAYFILLTLLSRTCSRHQMNRRYCCCLMLAPTGRWRRRLQLLTQACVSLPTGCLFETELCSSYEICVNGKISSNQDSFFDRRVIEKDEACVLLLWLNWNSVIFSDKLPAENRPRREKVIGRE